MYVRCRGGEKAFMDTKERELKAILSILSSALFGNAPELPDGLDWDALFLESVAQAVFPLVFQATQELLPGDVKRKWEGFFLQTLTLNIRAFIAHTRIHRLLTEHGILYVILKGCASARYYPEPELRTMGDVDLFVDTKDLDRCSELLISRGFNRIDDGTHDYHRTFTFRHIDYELHWRLTGVPTVGGERILAYYSSILADAAKEDNDNGSFMIPSDFHHGLILLLHTASHLTTTGIGLRHLCDWAVFVERFSDDAFCERFEACLKEIGLWELARILTAMCVRYLGASPKRWATGVDEVLAERLLGDIWHGGNFGDKDPQRKSYGVLMTDSDTHKIEDRSILQAFAAAIDRKAKLYHPKMAASHVFLPIAWIAVCCRYSWHALTKQRPWMKFGKDAGAARARKELFRQLKLFEDP